MSATNLMQPSPDPMSPSACFSNDHYAGTDSPPSELHFSSFLLQTTLVQLQALQPLLLRAPDLRHVLQLICNSLLISPLILSRNSQVQVLLHLILLLVNIPWLFILSSQRLPF
jgi:hypothetical protein